MHDQDLLTGLLAYQLRLASAGTLAWYAQSLEAAPDTTLLDFLLEKRAIHADDAKLLGDLTNYVMQAHGGNAGAALQAFGGSEAAEEAFARTAMPTEQRQASPEDETGDDRTMVAEQLPHGLPRQITPETAGRYTGGSEYARGGIGRILLVHDEQIGRDVILKELLPHRATSPNDSTLSRVPAGQSPGSPMRQSAAMIARFLQEAKITGQLEHPSIVPVYELGLRADGQLYYTMKLVRGNTLTDAIAACKSLDDRLALIRPFLDVCQAMAYAHAKGVIHRDLKPSNIMVGEFGECVVLDWGLAKMREGKDAHAEDMEKTMSRLRISRGELDAARTATNDIVGTPLYMAPEQARGEIDTVTYHSDVFSLGVILYEMLTGFTPHRWTNTYDTVRRVASLPVPPVRKHAPQTPPELAAICDKALQFDEADRYPTARELAADLRRFIEGAVVDAYAYSIRDQLQRLYRQHKPTVLATATAAASVLIIGVIAYAIVLHAWDNEREQRLIAQDAEDRAVAARDEEKIARDAAEVAKGEAEEALSRAQRQQYLAQIRLAQSRIDDQQMHLATEALEAAPLSERDWVWQYLYNEANAATFRIRSESSVLYVSYYDPTGQYILALRKSEPPALWRANDGVFLREFEGDVQSYNSASFSDNGKFFAAVGPQGMVDIWDVDTGDRLHRLAFGNSAGISVTFTTDNSFLWASFSDGTLVKWNIQTGELLLTEATTCTVGPILYPCSDSVMLSYCQQGEDGATIVARDATNGSELYVLPGQDLWLSPSRKIFLCTKKLETKQNPISTKSQYSLEIHQTSDGRLTQQFTGHSSSVVDASFSEDEQFLATVARDQTLRYWSMDSEDYVTQVITKNFIARVFILNKSNEILAISNDNRFEHWDISSSRLRFTFRGEGPGLSSAETSRDLTRVLVTSGFRSFEVFETPLYSSYRPAPDEFSKHSFYAAYSKLSPDESYVAILTNDGYIDILRLTDLEPLSKFQSFADNELLTIPATNNSNVLYIGAHHEVMLGNIVSGQKSAISETPTPATALALGQSERLAAWATRAGRLTVWDPRLNTVNYELQLDPGISTLEINDSDTTIAVGYNNSTIDLLDATTGNLVYGLSLQGGAIVDIAFQPSGQYLVAAAEEGTTFVIDTHHKHIAYQYSIDDSAWHLPEAIYSIRITQDGRYILFHIGWFATRIIDLRDGSILLDNTDNLNRIEPIGVGGEILRIAPNGTATLHMN